MRNQIRNFVIAAGLTAVVCSPLLKAQEFMESAQIPFGFQVGQTAMPAGTYTVTTAPSGFALQLRNEDTGKSVLVLPPAHDTGKSEPQLIFHCFGNHYFLAEIWAPGSTGYLLKKSSLEREFEGSVTRPAMALVAIVAR